MRSKSTNERTLARLNRQQLEELARWERHDETAGVKSEEASRRQVENTRTGWDEMERGTEKWQEEMEVEEWTGVGMEWEDG